MTWQDLALVAALGLTAFLAYLVARDWLRAWREMEES